MAKCAKLDKKVDFKFKGNKRQYDFNSDILERVKVATDLIEKRKESKALKSLDKVVEALNGRNKLIRMADKSQAGWDIVEGYLTDELASDSDDEKRIRQAEARTLKKKKTKVETYKQSKKYLSTRSGTVDTNIGETIIIKRTKQMGLNRLNSVQKATNLKKNQKWE